MNTIKGTIGDRFSEVLHKLKESRLIKNQGSIAVDTGYTVATLSEIKAGRMQLPDAITEHLQKKYNVNGNYLYTGKGPMFGKSEVEAEVNEAPGKYENKKGSHDEPLERIYLVESVKNLTETEKMNARSIERLIGMLESQSSYLQANLVQSNRNSQTPLDPGAVRGSEKAVRAVSGSKKKTG